MTPKTIRRCIALPVAVVMSIMALALAVEWTSPPLPELESLEQFMGVTAS